MQDSLGVIFFLLFVFFAVRMIYFVFRQRSKVKINALLSLVSLVVFISVIPESPKNKGAESIQAAKTSDQTGPTTTPSEAVPSSTSTNNQNAPEKKPEEATAQSSTAEPQAVKQPTKTQQENFEIPKITAKKLYEEYDVNVVSADATYMLRALLVTGTAYAVRRDEDLNIIIELESGNEVYPVYAIMAESEFRNVVDIKRGSILTLLCTGQSINTGSPILGNCRVKDKQ